MLIKKNCFNEDGIRTHDNLRCTPMQRGYLKPLRHFIKAEVPHNTTEAMYLQGFYKVHKHLKGVCGGSRGI